MGVIIFTNDDKNYRKGNYISMYGDITVSPSTPETTFILHNMKFSEADVLYWVPIVSYRMVVVVDKAPKLSSKTENCVIIDQNLKVADTDYSRAIRAALCWADRDRAYNVLKPIPIPLMNAFVKVNVDSMRLGRLLAQCRYTLSDDYTRAVMAYGIKPVSNFKWPKKSKNNDYILPSDMRKTDKHLEVIMNNDTIVSNAIRRDEPASLPQGLPKRKQEAIQWL
jgi:hypothetical protein